MSPWRGRLLAALSGAALLLASSPVAAWPLVWIALAPLLYAARDSKTAREAANLGAIAGLVFYIPALHWLPRVFGWLAGPFWCLFALWVALFAVLCREASRRASPERRGAFLEAATAGVLWTGIEYLRSEVWAVECSWLALGYALKPFPPMLQGASLVGVYGLGGLIAAVNASWVLALHRRRAPAFAATALLLALGFWGGARLERLDEVRARGLEVALVQSERYDVDRLAEASLDSGVTGGLWVWPEYGVTVQKGRERAHLGLLGRKLQGPPSTTVVGAASFPEGAPAENFAWVLDPGGELAGRYDKAHPIPFIESGRLRANPAPLPIDSAAGRLGVLLCYDLDFEDTARSLAVAGAELLVVPNADPFEWGAWQHRQHSDMAPPRAVETGLWIARAASSGHSQLIDPGGRVRAELLFGDSEVLTGDVELGSPGTFYVALGWLVAPLALALTAAFAVWAAAARFGKLS